MLYLFLVDTGTMMTFDMNLALESVTHLKQAISSQCQIPEDKQVLLISGGESLNGNARVCTYNAGIDTNPIFLFSKMAIESQTPPSCVDYGSDHDMVERVEGCISLQQPNFNTVVARTEMAQQLFDMAKQQMHICERLVHDQHLQQQGWAAVVANLEDFANAFKTSASQLKDGFQRFVTNREFYSDMLENFSKDLEILARIPVLPALLGNFKISDSENEDEEKNKSISLLKWISSKDNKSSVDQLIEQCRCGLEQFNVNSLDHIKEDVEKALDEANNCSMKEIRGLEERLFGLEKLMVEAKKLVDEQKDLAQAFYQNQTRASNLRDNSILPDLCASHQQQLQVMLKNHQNLRDIRRRCIKAKEELSNNLHARLRWIKHVSENLTEINNKMLIYNKNLDRLKTHLDVAHEIHLAPKVYFASVVEVVRRKSYSSPFLLWASELARQSSDMHEGETGMRKEFNNRFGSHFLRSMFPGMGDFPPSFATQIPDGFDDQLPDLSESDIEVLKSLMPDYCNELMVPSHVPMPDPHLKTPQLDETNKLLSERDSEIKALKQKLAELESNMTTSFHFGQNEKLAVLNCEIGDIVLIYYEEKFESYIVFTLNPTLHFLHTDSLENLFIKSDVTEPTQRWTLAEITDKDFCQARKAQNRYRVSLGTKFYRVKAKQWAKVSALLKKKTSPTQQQPQLPQAASTSTWSIDSNLPSLATSLVIPVGTKPSTSTSTSTASAATFTQSFISTFPNVLKK